MSLPWFPPPPAPEAEPVLDRAVPGALVRAGAAVLVTTMLLVAWSATWPVGAVTVLVMALAGVLAGLLPSPARVGVALLAAGVLVLVGGPASVVRTLALVLLVHLVVWACSTAARVTWRMRVELGVLRDGLADVARVQVGAQALAVVALVVGGRDLAAGDVVRVVAILAAAAVVAVVLPRSGD
ncbi:hypothetical protein [Cellulomonas sp.]|uniref:hypothetical protein n=1 Tax=Cellulomonas sp. TaxID=40001 RepID=UPI00258B45E3|nr:hypothetical protein [Cellulomonas sp.]MCR6688668.1 hypothetical protein [Cellulomonas sp.]